MMPAAVRECSVFFLRLDSLGKVGQIQPSLFGFIKRFLRLFTLLRQFGELDKVTGVLFDFAVQPFQLALQLFHASMVS